MMFGYATNETENYMPLSLDLAHRILLVLADIRREGKEMTYLRPDAKSQVTIEYDDNGTPVRIDTIVVSTQHDEFILPADNSAAAQLKADEEMLAVIRKDVIEVLMPRVIASINHPKVLALFNDHIIYHVNPTGKFVIGGLMEIQDSPDVRSLWTLMVERELMVAVLSPVKIQAK